MTVGMQHLAPSHQTCSPRIDEPARRGCIVKAGRRRATRSIRQAALWIAAAGEDR